MSPTNTAEPETSHSTVDHASEVAAGERYQFGRNWSRFLKVLDDDRIATACESLETWLGEGYLCGKSFLDIGCGSGLFSLAAVRLGASVVHSFDFDPQSVACCQELKTRYYPEMDDWRIEQASCLDAEYMGGLAPFDVVYSWGVLHHTGEMWRAMDLACKPVQHGGKFFVAIYNRQKHSTLWRKAKQIYCSGPLGAAVVIAAVIPIRESMFAAKALLTFKNPLRRFTDYRKGRGMSLYHDWLDWLGGYPFEVASPEEVLEFCQDRGFTLTRLATMGAGNGCNQFVFLKSADHCE